VADELYRSARRLRVFVARPVTAPLERRLFELITLPPAEVDRRLSALSSH
jgi:hypothetical protein